MILGGIRGNIKIWAHRGCSQRYPESILLSFEKAAGIKGLVGIELDIQPTKDDEKVDRTTDGIGFVRYFTLAALKRLHINAGADSNQQIPAIKEVLDLLEPGMKLGLKLNIELKNSVYSYHGMEQKIIELIHDRGLQEGVVYSTFNAFSLERIKNLDDKAELGILDRKVSDCLYKLQGGCGAVALHPYWQSIDLPAERISGYSVRAWFTGHLYPEKPTGTKLDLISLEKQGITDVFLNEPEVYLD